MAKRKTPKASPREQVVDTLLQAITAAKLGARLSKRNNATIYVWASPRDRAFSATDEFLNDSLAEVRVLPLSNYSQHANIPEKVRVLKSSWKFQGAEVRTATFRKRKDGGFNIERIVLAVQNVVGTCLAYRKERTERELAEKRNALRLEEDTAELREEFPELFTLKKPANFCNYTPVQLRRYMERRADGSRGVDVNKARYTLTVDVHLVSADDARPILEAIEEARMRDVDEVPAENDA